MRKQLDAPSAAVDSCGVALRGLKATVVLLMIGLLAAGCGSSLNNEQWSETETTSKGGSAFAPDKASNEKAARLPKAADAFASSSIPGNAAYKIGPQDVLDISVFKAPELARQVQVADAGTINPPLVGEVKAAGRTAQEIERDLAAKLGVKHLKSPQVTVYVKEFNSQRVTVEGAVRKPGVYRISGETTLMQSLAMAQGLDPTSDTGNVIIFRQVDGKRYAAKFDIDQIRAGKAEDPVIVQGDMVVANASAMKAAWEGFLQVLPSSSGFVRAF
jgi:polysaccharide biosynthesis/export protein